MERSLATLRDTLGEAHVDATLAEGWALSLAEAVSLAAGFARTPGEPEAMELSPDDLTPREREVLQLLAAQQMDQEIAAALFLSPCTVSWHVRSILAKLGVTSRRDAVYRARAAGLV